MHFLEGHLIISFIHFKILNTFFHLGVYAKKKKITKTKIPIRYMDKSLYKIVLQSVSMTEINWKQFKSLAIEDWLH